VQFVAARGVCPQGIREELAWLGEAVVCHPSELTITIIIIQTHPWWFFDVVGVVGVLGGGVWVRV
jgi:hypothetical protein